MDDLNKNLESDAFDDDYESEGVFEETVDFEAPSEESVTGLVHISEDVLSELAKKTLASIDGVQPASPGIASKLGIGRKSSEGVRVVLEDGAHPTASVDVYIMVKFGIRIPDMAWDVQEQIKKNIEEYTGYKVKAVNVNVQGIYFKERPVQVEGASEEERNDDRQSEEEASEPERSTQP
ncbi:MAG: Asp23/Gls24 family envelope stress response protein [Synergistaceae bacterium]|nr:Asp23/Gls24 family envelope stress response protein [Synergistota bacterium]NLM71205.1 Asp23/Gls24 family envelope stress response protein [Synergistaceae bacterium]